MYLYVLIRCLNIFCDSLSMFNIALEHSPFCSKISQWFAGFNIVNFQSCLKLPDSNIVAQKQILLFQYKFYQLLILSFILHDISHCIIIIPYVWWDAVGKIGNLPSGNQTWQWKISHLVRWFSQLEASTCFGDFPASQVWFLQGDGNIVRHRIYPLVF